MIKRVIGVVFTILVFVVVIAAAINFGEYRSMVFNRGTEPRQSVERVEAEKPAVDSSAVKKSKPKKQLTPEQIEARKRALAKKKAERAAMENL
jgi:hypothetical protein